MLAGPGGAGQPDQVGVGGVQGTEQQVGDPVAVAGADHRDVAFPLLPARLPAVRIEFGGPVGNPAAMPGRRAPRRARQHPRFQFGALLAGQMPGGVDQQGDFGPADPPGPPHRERAGQHRFQLPALHRETPGVHLPERERGADLGPRERAGADVVFRQRPGEPSDRGRGLGTEVVLIPPAGDRMPDQLLVGQPVNVQPVEFRGHRQVDRTVLRLVQHLIDRARRRFVVGRGECGEHLGRPVVTGVAGDQGGEEGSVVRLVVPARIATHRPRTYVRSCHIRAGPVKPKSVAVQRKVVHRTGAARAEV